jgi:hypothetical protein
MAAAISFLFIGTPAVVAKKKFSAEEMLAGVFPDCNSFLEKKHKRAACCVIDTNQAVKHPNLPPPRKAASR